MAKVALDITERCDDSRKVRRNGEIPCVIYGKALKENIIAKMTNKSLLKLLESPSSTIFTLNYKGQAEHCVVKELQKNNFGKVIHVDFQYVNKDEIIKLNIPVVFEGEGVLGSKALLLETFVDEIELKGEVDKFPEEVKFDVSNLTYGGKVFAKDLELPEGIKLDLPEDTLLANVVGNVSAEEDEDSADTTTAE